jgi:hypothetical protein
MSDSLYETKLGSINSSVEILGSKSMKLDLFKWQKTNEYGIDEIPEKHGDYDDMEPESRDESSNNEQKQFKSLEEKPCDQRDSVIIEKIN